VDKIPSLDFASTERGAGCCYAVRMSRKAQIAIVGLGRLGTALSSALARAGHRVREIVSHSQSSSTAKAQKLARAVNARTANTSAPELDATVIWLCVPDREIASVARQLAGVTNWKGKIALHSSGALTSDLLDVLRQRGAAVASVHPLMSFARGAIPSLKNVPFGIEGDTVALRAARKLIRDLGGTSFVLNPSKKAAYHAWGAFASPLLIALLATAEQVARAAGLAANDARKKMLPIVLQTVSNYGQLGPAAAFSGPIVRGDTETVREHLRILQKLSSAKEVYLALAQAALRYLPAHNRHEIERVLQSGAISSSRVRAIQTRTQHKHPAGDRQARIP
jgi:predicted short-subunit dehydrogenase-like oxidoreductase (DUF2520 family)